MARNVSRMGMAGLKREQRGFMYVAQVEPEWRVKRSISISFLHGGTYT